MELRATEDTDLSQDLIPPLPPIAASLHDRFLHSHCSSCFLPIIPEIPPSPSQNVLRTPSQNTPAVPFSSCPRCNSVFYCSSTCSSSDYHRHVSSSECRLLLRSVPSTCYDSADIRTALRLLHSLETLGFLPTSSPLPGRVGGLFAGSLHEILNEGSELGSRIREGAELMRQARMGSVNEVTEELALWAVLANAVEVHAGDVAALGIAVYGPGFSWFNHSCAPNACYRFELHGGRCGSVGYRVSSAGTGEAPEMKIWFTGESKLIQGLHTYGPRIIVRSIKPIKKGKQVFIAYTDLLQPKAMRHLDLWLKYRFTCCCERCLASPEMYIDHILNCDARNLPPNHDNFSDANSEELADFLDQTISEYMSGGDPETCSKKLENMLSKIFKYPQFEEEPSTFRLHPLHYLSLNAYLTLASVYRILASNITATSSGEGDLSEASKMMRRAAAAYSLLLAGATHHLFLFESSLIASAAVFWVNAGESVMGLVRSCCEPKCSLVSCHFQFDLVEDTSVSMDDCKATSMRFCECISTNLTKSWPYLVQGLSYLEDIESPIDFNGLGTKTIPNNLTDGAGVEFCEHSGYKYRVETHLEDDKKGLLQLAVYCLAYGRYLASICYGSQCDLSDKVRNLLHDIK